MLWVKVGTFNSDQVFMPLGTTQGSVLRTYSFFTTYLQPINETIKDHNLQYYQYADDTQLYKTLNANYLNLIIQTPQECIYNLLILVD